MLYHHHRIPDILPVFFFLQILGGRDVPHYVAIIKSGQNPGKMAATL